MTGCCGAAFEQRTVIGPSPGSALLWGSIRRRGGRLWRDNIGAPGHGGKQRRHPAALSTTSVSANPDDPGRSNHRCPTSNITYINLAATTCEPIVTNHYSTTNYQRSAARHQDGKRRRLGPSGGRAASPRLLHGGRLLPGSTSISVSRTHEIKLRLTAVRTPTHPSPETPGRGPLIWGPSPIRRRLLFIAGGGSDVGVT